MLALALVAHPAAARAPAARLGGLLPLDAARAAGWCASGAWRFPVGDAYDLEQPDESGAPGFRINRNVGEGRRRAHQGADLANGRGGDAVRAAANGIVVTVTEGWSGGYGHAVVLAHRLDEGGLAYSVYAHLVPGSATVSPGDVVAAGSTLGRVGGSGRVTTLHLHFEVRLAEDAELRWEKARVVDPVLFVRSRLPGAASVAGASARLREWAEFGALGERGLAPDAALDRPLWWRLLARAARDSSGDAPAEPESLGVRLAALGVLDDHAAARRALEWRDVARDVEALRRSGVRLARPAFPRDSLDAWCDAAYGDPHAARHVSRLATRRDGRPRLLDAWLLLADAALRAPRAGVGFADDASDEP